MRGNSQNRRSTKMTRSEAKLHAPRTLLASALAIVVFGLGIIGSCMIDREQPPESPPVLRNGPRDIPKPVISNKELMRVARACIKGGFDAAQPEHRGTAYDMTAETRDMEAVPDLRGQVESEPDPKAMGRIAAALGKLGKPQSRTLLRKLYRQIDRPLKPWFAEALLRLGMKKARTWLIELAADEDLHISAKSTLALAELSGPGDPEAMRALEALYDRRDELRSIHREATYIILAELARLGQMKARERLHSFLDEDPLERRVIAAAQLARIGDTTGKGVLLAALKGQESEYRARAGIALIELGDYSGFDALTAALGDKLAARRQRSALALGKMGDRRSLAALDRLREGDSDRSVRITSCAAIAFVIGLNPKVLVQASVDWAREAFDSRDASTRDAAVRVAGDLPVEKALPIIERGVVDPVSRVRRSSARSAAKFKNNPQVAKAVEGALKVEKDPAVKEEQIAALARIASPVVKPTLQELARKTDRAGVLAMGALVAVGEVEAAQGLDRAYRNRSKSIRLAVMKGAVLANNAAVVPTLEKGVKDRVFDVRFTAAEGLAFYRAVTKMALAVLRDGLDETAQVAGRARAALLALGEVVTDGMPVAEMIASTDVTVRRVAVPIIAAMDWQEASPFLRQVLLDGDREVRREAVDAIEEFQDQDKEGVRRLYKQLINDRDEVVRYKAKSRLASLLPMPAEAVDLGTPAAPNTEPVEEARKAVDEAVESFAGAKKELDEVMRLAESRIAKRATDEKTFEETKAYRKKIAQRHARVVAAQREISRLANNVTQAAQALPDSLPAVKDALQAAETQSESTAQQVAMLDGKVGKLGEEVDDWLEAETAQIEFYCETAETAIPAGRLSEARRNLRAAEQLGKREPCVLFTRGLFFDEKADGEESDRKRIRYLKKARKSYEKFLAVGDDDRVEHATERISEIDEELTR